MTYLPRALLGVLVLGFSFSAFASTPLSFEGWDRCLDQPYPEHYDFQPAAAPGGTELSGVRLYSKSDDPALVSHIGVYNTLDASPYVGKRIRFSVDVLANRLTGADSSAMSYLAISRKARPDEVFTDDECFYFFDNMSNRPYKTVGTIGTLDIVAQVSPNAQYLLLGPMLEGNGDILLFNPRIDIVDATVPELTPYDPNNLPELGWCPAE